ncbi:MAG: 50S ribosomal protein L16 [Candidatus Aenigmatarchaeota archaeon]
MALRPGRCFRRIERPYTRISYKVKNKNYIAGAPPTKVREFERGNKSITDYIELKLIAKEDVQVRDNALESARILCNKYLEKRIGPLNYYLKILKYPHHILREHPIAMGAGADRYSQGMRNAFGRPIGRAVQLFKGETIILLRIKKEFLNLGKEALRIAASKLPKGYKIVVSSS